MISIKYLSKKFGDVFAVKEISFKVKKGEILGLLGENGAGKTTTLRMLATMLRPASGTATISGYDVIKEPEKVRENIGILFGGESGLYDRLTGRENIEYFGELNDVNKVLLEERIAFLAKELGMEEFLEKRVSKLSKGMKQKVAFARAIVHNPPIMLLDEPSSGLDVGTTRDTHQFIKNCKEEGKTVVFSSHIMSEVEKLCDRIAIIHKGELIEIGTIEELKMRHDNTSLEEIFIRMVGGKNEN